MNRKQLAKHILPRIALCVLAGTVLYGCATADSPLGVRTFKRTFVGATVGVGINTPSGTYHSQTAEPDCGGFTGGSNTGLNYGLTFEYLFQQKASSSGIVARIFYWQMPGQFTADYGAVPFLNPTTGKPVTVAETHVADVTYNLINARIAYGYGIPTTPITVEVGPSIGLASTVNLKQTLHLDQGVAPDVSFGNGSADSVVYNQSPASKSGLRLGLWAGVQYKLDVGWWIISPYVGFDVGLSKVLSTESWSLSSIAAGVDFKYGIK